MVYAKKRVVVGSVDRFDPATTAAIKLHLENAF
jgi:hypothetical protein